MVTLTFSKPIHIANHFCVPADVSRWCSLSYNSVSPGGGNTPARVRAAFSTLTRGLVPKSCLAWKLKQVFGVYIVALDVPEPAFYVGVAARADGRSKLTIKPPDGILKRLQTHRIKTTGSHVGVTPNKHGGVNHTLGWRGFAPCRAKFFQTKKADDLCDDMRLVIGQLNQTNPGLADKPTLEYFEWLINYNRSGVYNQMCKLLWPNLVGTPYVLTTQVNHGRAPSQATIVLWDGSKISTW
jgi:hypothetical protein